MEDSTSDLSEEEQMKIWRERAIEKQTFYYERLKDRTWEKYTENDIIYLQNKIGFAIFGLPKDDNPQDVSKSDLNQNTDENVPVNVQSDLSSPTAAEMNSDNSECKKEEEEEENSDGVDTLTDSPRFGANSLSDCDFDKFLELVGVLFDLNFKDETVNESKPETGKDHTESSDSDNEDLEYEQFLLNKHLISNSTNSDTKEEFPLYYSDKDQLKQIEDMISSIKECNKSETDNKDIYVAFLFVVGKIDTFIADFPIIRVRGKTKKNEEMIYFVDCTGRRYKSWSDFLEDNYFPSCFYCYPKNGFYSSDEDGNVELEFGKSPESKVLRKIAKVGDVASGIAGLGCGIVAAAALFLPVAAPLLIGTAAAGVTTGIWTTGRAVYKLVDRVTHNQNLTDQEARGCWLNLVTGVLGGASVGALSYTQYLARNGQVIGKAAQFVVNGIQTTSFGVSGLNIGHQCYTMYENRRVTWVEMAGLSVSVLFFFNAAVNMKTAETMLKESQNEIINNFKSQLSRRQGKAFNRLVRETGGNNVIEGNATVIKTVINLEDPQAYFKDVLRATKAANKTNSKLSFSKDASGKLTVNKKITVDPETINSMSNKAKNKMFSSSKKFIQNTKNYKSFQRDMLLISKKEKLSFDSRTLGFKKKIDFQSSLDFKINGKEIFSSLKSKNPGKINGFLEILNDKQYYSIVKENIKQKYEEKDFSNIQSIVNIVFNVLQKVQSGEAKEKYQVLMKYYEENFRESFEEIIEKIYAVLENKMDAIFKESNCDVKKSKHVFFRKVEDRTDFSDWYYFELYFKKLWNSSPDRKSVVELKQKVGSLFILSDHPRVHSVFITAIRMDALTEKIILVAFTH